MMWDFSGGSADTYMYGRPPPSPSLQPPYSPPSPFPSPTYESSYPMPSPHYAPAPQFGHYLEPVPRSAPVGGNVHIHYHRSGHHHHSHHTPHPSHPAERRLSFSQQPQPQHSAVLTRPAPVTIQPHQNKRSGILFSKCTGAKKAVCIGINYRGQHNELHGCVNDARNVRQFLIAHRGYRPENIILLVDDTNDPKCIPTKANMFSAMHWLVRHAQPHDSLFFHYSGHGGQVEDKDGDEIDGFDETIFPLDYERAGYIKDDLMHTIMVKPLPAGCRLTAVFDSCHSGSVLDLPYLYHTDGRVKGSQVDVRHQKEKATDADVISWSGCKDSQTSADTWEKGVAVGAMSYAFMKSISHNPDQSYQQLLRSIRGILKDRYSQKPQLSSSHHIDTTLRFIM